MNRTLSLFPVPGEDPPEPRKRTPAEPFTVGAIVESMRPKPGRADALHAIQALTGFIGRSQLAAVASGMRGEERQFFYDKMVELADRVAGMPQTCEQQSLGEQGIVSLHYFAGGQANWWITEKDKGDPDDQKNGVPPQSQAFGLADLFADGGELGYISIPEILSCGGELDFHFTPRTLAQVRKEQRSRN